MKIREVLLEAKSACSNKANKPRQKSNFVGCVCVIALNVTDAQ